MNETRTCKQCGESKPLDQYRVHSKKTGSYKRICKTCEGLADEPVTTSAQPPVRHKRRMRVCLIDRRAGTYQVMVLESAQSKKIDPDYDVAGFYEEAGFQVWEVNHV